ncbi:MAG: dephospho-CoA kinase [Kiritimatiellae bacterium]|nr:dephospho-CoA kinase [Kiritimatiellia bacterium]
MAEACFQACGCRVLDADVVVHQLEAAGGAAVEPIGQLFGKGVLSEDGGIHRAALAGLVFQNPEARQQLEAILHPLVRQTVHQWLAAAAPGEISVFSAALLYECRWEKDWQGVVCVAASRETQLRRMCQVRQMTREAAEARLAAQMPLAEKVRRADWILKNDTDEPEPLQQQVKALVALWRQRFCLV